LKTLLLILEYAPYVLRAVTAVEDIYKSEPGASKKKLVLDAIGAAAGVGESVPDPTLAVISSLIDSTVAALNQLGIFSHGSKS